MVNYVLDIPDGPNNPSNDQPNMKINTNAIQTLISVDHVGFNTSGSPPNGVGGHHLQVSFDGKNVPGAQTDPQSVLYTNSGTASTFSELFYRNQGAILPISPIKAFGSFVLTQSGTTFINNFNCTLSTNPAGTVSTITIATGATFGTTFVVIPYINVAVTLVAAITGANTFTLSSSFVNGAIISFIVLQA